jgi:hypothetical protein
MRAPYEVVPSTVPIKLAFRYEGELHESLHTGSKGKIVIYSENIHTSSGAPQPPVQCVLSRG